MKKVVSILATLLLLISISCRKGGVNPSWNADYLLPVVKTTFSIHDIGDSLVETDANGFVSLVYQNSLLDFDIDTLVQMPDTVITNNLTLLPGYNAYPSTPFYSQNENIKFNLGEPELSQIIVKSGKLTVELESTLPEPVDVVINVPSATKLGVPFQRTESVAAASGSTNAILTKTYDITDYSFDMRGVNKNSVNTIYYNLQAAIAASGSQYTIKPSDKVKVKFSFEEVYPKFIKGYFGQHAETIGPENSAFSFLNGIDSGAIDFEDVFVDLEIINSVGIDGTFKLNQLSSYNSRTGNTVALNHSIVGNTVNINRAVKTNGTPPVTPWIYTQNLDKNNSNIDVFVENLPDQIQYGFDLSINPLGNVSNGNDFYYSDYPFQANLNVRIPLSLTMNGLTMYEEVDFPYASEEVEKFNSGSFKLYYKNGFPLDATIFMDILDVNGVKIDQLQITGNIASGQVDASYFVIAPTSGEITIPLSADNIAKFKKAGKIRFKTVFNTVSITNYVKIYDHYELELKLVGDFNYHVGL